MVGEKQLLWSLALQCWPPEVDAEDRQDEKKALKKYAATAKKEMQAKVDEEEKVGNLEGASALNEYNPFPNAVWKKKPEAEGEALLMKYLTAPGACANYIDLAEKLERRMLRPWISCCAAVTDACLNHGGYGCEEGARGWNFRTTQDMDSRGL